ncbi:3'-5' exonuclease [Microbacterium sp. As-52]|uniref:3'-5' exonuclease n=1 Tax=Microbacterium sp. As-52 TaxID=3390503 RepID=UPI003CE8214D
MAILRAVHLANLALDDNRTLLVTYNKALRGYLQHLTGRAGANLDIETYHRVARGYLHGRGLMGEGDILDGAMRHGVLRQAIRDVVEAGRESEVLARPVDFFADELDWISGNGLATRHAYLEAERRGRATALGAGPRKAIWHVREEYLTRRAARGRRYDWWELPSAILRELENDETPRRYRHILIDEAQDLPPQAIRSLVKLMQPGGTVTLFADYAQQLYGYHTSYASCGLRVRKAETFRENYRNSAGIARLAIAASALPHFPDRSDLVEPTSPATAGVPPTLYRAASHEDAMRAVQSQASQLASIGTVAILAKTWREAAYWAGRLPHRELNENQAWRPDGGLYVGTYYSAKGLEFDAVILPDLGSARFPDPDRVAAFGRPEALERDARLLYVGITRARAELLVTFRGELTELLPHAESGLWAVTGSDS